MRRVYCLISRCLGCRSCEIACAVSHSASRRMEEAVREEPRPRQRMRVETAAGRPFPIQCRHCEDPACIEACIAGAIRKDPETGLVTSDPTRCVGCWMCVMACPYGVISRRKEDGVALKCDQCRELDEPACVAACPTGALYFCEREEFEDVIRRELAQIE
ncbi:MAG: 4Fe-4S dicluster domain-containing protein [PVC group bacterium]